MRSSNCPDGNFPRGNYLGVNCPRTNSVIERKLGAVLARRSPPEVFCKKRVLKNFAKFTEKHLCQSHFLNKVSALLKKKL